MVLTRNFWFVFLALLLFPFLTHQIKSEGKAPETESISAGKETSTDKGKGDVPVQISPNTEKDVDLEKELDLEILAEKAKELNLPSLDMLNNPGSPDTDEKLKTKTTSKQSSPQKEEKTFPEISPHGMEDLGLAEALDVGTLNEKSEQLNLPALNMLTNLGNTEEEEQNSKKTKSKQNSKKREEKENIDKIPVNGKEGLGISKLLDVEGLTGKTKKSEFPSLNLLKNPLSEETAKQSETKGKPGRKKKEGDVLGPIPLDEDADLGLEKMLDIGSLGDETKQLELPILSTPSNSGETSGKQDSKKGKGDILGEIPLDGGDDLGLEKVLDFGISPDKKKQFDFPLLDMLEESGRDQNEESHPKETAGKPIRKKGKGNTLGKLPLDNEEVLGKENVLDIENSPDKRKKIQPPSVNMLKKSLHDQTEEPLQRVNTGKKYPKKEKEGLLGKLPLDDEEDLGLDALDLGVSPKKSKSQLPSLNIPKKFRHDDTEQPFQRKSGGKQYSKTKKGDLFGKLPLDDEEELGLDALDLGFSPKKSKSQLPSSNILEKFRHDDTEQPFQRKSGGKQYPKKKKGDLSGKLPLDDEEDLGLDALDLGVSPSKEKNFKIPSLNWQKKFRPDQTEEPFKRENSAKQYPKREKGDLLGKLPLDDEELGLDETLDLGISPDKEKSDEIPSLNMMKKYRNDQNEEPFRRKTASKQYPKKEKGNRMKKLPLNDEEKLGLEKFLEIGTSPDERKSLEVFEKSRPDQTEEPFRKEASFKQYPKKGKREFWGKLPLDDEEPDSDNEVLDLDISPDKRKNNKIPSLNMMKKYRPDQNEEPFRKETASEQYPKKEKGNRMKKLPLNDEEKIGLEKFLDIGTSPDKTKSLELFEKSRPDQTQEPFRKETSFKHYPKKEKREFGGKLPLDDEEPDSDEVLDLEILPDKLENNKIPSLNMMKKYRSDQNEEPVRRETANKQYPKRGKGNRLKKLPLNEEEKLGLKKFLDIRNSPNKKKNIDTFGKPRPDQTEEPFRKETSVKHYPIKEKGNLLGKIPLDDEELGLDEALDLGISPDKEKNNKIPSLNMVKKYRPDQNEEPSRRETASKQYPKKEKGDLIRALPLKNEETGLDQDLDLGISRDKKKVFKFPSLNRLRKFQLDQRKKPIGGESAGEQYQKKGKRNYLGNLPLDDEKDYGLDKSLELGVFSDKKKNAKLPSLNMLKKSRSDQTEDPFRKETASEQNPKKEKSDLLRELPLNDKEELGLEKDLELGVLPDKKNNLQLPSLNMLKESRPDQTEEPRERDTPGKQYPGKEKGSNIEKIPSDGEEELCLEKALELEASPGEKNNLQLPSLNMMKESRPDKTEDLFRRETADKPYPKKENVALLRKLPLDEEEELDLDKSLNLGVSSYKNKNVKLPSLNMLKKSRPDQMEEDSQTETESKQNPKKGEMDLLGKLPLDDEEELGLEKDLELEMSPDKKNNLQLPSLKMQKESRQDKTEEPRERYIPVKQYSGNGKGDNLKKMPSNYEEDLNLEKALKFGVFPAENKKLQLPPLNMLKKSRPDKTDDLFRRETADKQYPKKENGALLRKLPLDEEEELDLDKSLNSGVSSDKKKNVKLPSLNMLKKSRPDQIEEDSQTETSSKQNLKKENGLHLGKLPLDDKEEVYLEKYFDLGVSPDKKKNFNLPSLNLLRKSRSDQTEKPGETIGKDFRKKERGDFSGKLPLDDKEENGIEKGLDLEILPDETRPDQEPLQRETAGKQYLKNKKDHFENIPLNGEDEFSLEKALDLETSSDKKKHFNFPSLDMLKNSLPDQTQELPQKESAVKRYPKKRKGDALEKLPLKDKEGIETGKELDLGVMPEEMNKLQFPSVSMPKKVGTCRTNDPFRREEVNKQYLQEEKPGLLGQLPLDDEELDLDKSLDLRVSPDKNKNIKSPSLNMPKKRRPDQMQEPSRGKTTGKQYSKKKQSDLLGKIPLDKEEDLALTDVFDLGILADKNKHFKLPSFNFRKKLRPDETEEPLQRDHKNKEADVLGGTPLNGVGDFGLAKALEVGISGDKKKELDLPSLNLMGKPQSVETKKPRQRKTVSKKVPKSSERYANGKMPLNDENDAGLSKPLKVGSVSTDEKPEKPEWRARKKAAPKKSHPLINKYSKPYLLQKKMKPLAVFKKHFVQGVIHCENLTRVFDIGEEISPDEFAAGGRYIFMSLNADNGMEDIGSFASVAFRNVGSFSKKLTPAILLETAADVLANYMFQTGMLNSKTETVKLSKSVVGFLKEVASNAPAENYPRSKVTSYFMGFIGFLSQQKLINDETDLDLAQAYANKWKSLQNIKGEPASGLPQLKSPAKNPLVRTSDKVCRKSKPVEIFHTVFHRAIKYSPLLSQLFKIDPRTTPSEFSRGVYYVSSFLFLKFGVSDSAILADFMSTFIQQAKTVQSSALISVTSNAVAKYLKGMKVLNIKNAQKLAMDYGYVMEKIAGIAFRPNYPETQVVTVIFSIMKFLIKNQAFDSEHGPHLAYFYGNEWRCQIHKQ